MDRLRRHLTYANVTATLALIVAVAGGTTAIAMKATAPKNSVTSKSIRPYNVTARDLTRLIAVRSQTTFSDPGPPDGTFASASATAPCPAGTRVITGGGFVDTNQASLVGSDPISEGWVVSAKADGTNQATITVIARCLSKRAEKPTP
jgi:hypothetical protein